jgi:hypothetical protein
MQPWTWISTESVPIFDRFRAALILGAVVALVWPGVGAARAEESPVGQWDFRITGADTGFGIIEFLGDNTLAGSIVILSGAGSDHVFDFQKLTGMWVFDTPRQIIGYFEPVDLSVEPSIEASFTARVRSGKKVTMKATSINTRPLRAETRPLRLAGVPVETLADVSGTWAAKVRKRETRSTDFNEWGVEMLELAPSGFLNQFDLEGSGPDFRTTGKVLLSRGNRFSLVSRELDGPLRVLAGKVKKGRVRLVGKDDTNSRVRMSARHCGSETPSCLP